MPVTTADESLTPQQRWLWAGMHILFLTIGLAATLYFAFYGPMSKVFDQQSHDTFDINFSLSSSLAYVYDTEHNYSINNIADAPFQTLQPLSQFNWLRLPILHHPVWLAFDLQDTRPPGQSPEPVYIELGFPVINHIDVFVLNAQGDVISHDRSGDEVPLAQRDLQLLLPTVKFHLQPGELHRVYIRLESDSFLASPLFILTADQLIHVTN